MTVNGDEKNTPATGPETASSRFALSLRIWHPSMMTAEIAGAVQRTPDIAQNAGDARSTPKGEPLSGIYKSTYCVFRLEQAPLALLEGDLGRQLSILEGRKSQLLNVTATGGRIEFFIGIFLGGNDGFTLTADLQARMAALGVDLAFDLYDRD